MGIKQAIEAAAIVMVKCPSCGAAPNEKCHYIGSGGGLARVTKVKTHQRRLSTYVANHMVEKVGVAKAS